MMWGLRLCCEGADIIREEQKIVVEQKTEPNNSTKSWDASVFPAKRKSVKKMACNCVIHCICGKCFNAINKANLNYKTLLLPPKPAASLCSCSPPHPLHAAGNYGNKRKSALCKLGQMK